jgi:hypothetical protein
MIDKDKIVKTVLEKLKKLPVDHYLDMRTYKRNRSLVIVKKSEDDFLIIEDGYFRENYQVQSDKLKKTLTTLLKKEFTRSHKVRLYVMGEFNEEKIKNTARKII